jgi:hypothetical protein
MTAAGKTIVVLLSLVIIPYLFANAANPVNSEALGFYSDGAYRHSISVLSNKGSLSSLENYLMARDFQELKETEKALPYFEKVNLKDLKKEKYASFFIESCCYFYSKALREHFAPSLASFSNETLALRKMISSLKKDSIYYQEVNEIYLFYLWKNKDYKAISSLGGKDKLSKSYQALCHFMEGETNTLAFLLDQMPENLLLTIYPDISNRIEINTLESLNRDQLFKLWTISLNFNRWNSAEKILNRYETLSNKDEFLERAKMTLETKKGNRQKVIDQLFQDFQKNEINEKKIRLLLSHLYRQANYTRAYEVIQKYPFFESDMIKILSKSGRYEELYQWYLKNKDKKEFREQHQRDIFLILLQNKIEAAKEMLPFALEKNEDYYFTYISALFDLNENKPETAYPKLLSVLLNHPFTYEWIVAKKYEAGLRTNFMPLYETEIFNQIGKLKKMPLKEKVYLSLGLLEIDTNLTGTINKKTAFQKDWRKFQNSVKYYFALSEKNFSSGNYWIQKRDPFLMGWNQELFQRIEKNVTNSTKYYLAYHYMDWYEKINLGGEIVPRLNYFLTKKLEGRQYHPLLEKKLFRGIYPFHVFSTIESFVSNTNESLWIISAFREESHFKKEALSYAGAVGFVQMMPATAQTIQKNLRKEDWNLYDYSDNKSLGIIHFQHLFKKYKDNPYYSLAAYNAGETVINRWIRRYTFTNELWNELIEYDETREYVKKIVLTRYFYDLEYGASP